MSSPRISFSGGRIGGSCVSSITTLCGEGLLPVDGVTVQVNGVPSVPDPIWTLAGVISNLRYTTGREVADLQRTQSSLARPEATCASLIPIRKSPIWWGSPQDERRAIYEERSRHTTIGIKYLPHIARRLHHSRDIGQPFEFLTWFEFAPEHESMYVNLLEELRSTEEWCYVDREVDIRMVWEASVAA